MKMIMTIVMMEKENGRISVSVAYSNLLLDVQEGQSILYCQLEKMTRDLHQKKTLLP